MDRESQPGENRSLCGQQAPKTAPKLGQRGAFTLIELLVVIGIIGILASLLMPALSRAKQQANSTKCLNNLRQLNLGLVMYADDNDGQFPPRRQAPNTWIQRLLSFYRDTRVLKCPGDSFANDRSYIINGFNDYFQGKLDPRDYEKFKQYRWPEGMKPANVILPSETITFAEKKSSSHHVHMDFYQGSGNDVQETDQKRHNRGANFAFVDGSVRYLKEGQSLSPVNLWAVMEIWRNAPTKKTQ